MRQGSDRYQYLDRLRGIACMMVVAGHYNEAFQPPQTPKMLKPYYDGGLAVGIFFLMSGFVLTGSFCKGHYSIKRLLASRMFRLLVPGIIAICMASVLFLFYQPVARSAAMLSGSVSLWQETQPTSAMVLPGGLLGLLLGFRDTSLFHFSSFIYVWACSVPATWTISYEVYGSVVMLILARLYHFKKPWWILAVTVCLCAFGIREVGLFAIGHIARIIWKPNQAEKFNTFANMIGVFAVAAFTAMDLHLQTYTPVLDVAVSGIFTHGSPLHAADPIAAIVVFSVVIYSGLLQRMLSVSPLVYLGRLSFSVYLIHFPIMLGFGSDLYLLAGHRSPVATWMVFFVGVVVTVIFAVAFERFVDAPAVAFSRSIRKGVYFTGMSAKPAYNLPPE